MMIKSRTICLTVKSYYFTVLEVVKRGVTESQRTGMDGRGS